MELRGGVKATISDAYYCDYKKDKIKTFASGTFFISPRVGLSLFLAEHHRIEFVTKIPVYAVGSSGSDQNNINQTLIYHPIEFMLGYKFVF